MPPEKVEVLRPETMRLVVVAVPETIKSVVDAVPAVIIVVEA